MSDAILEGLNSEQQRAVTTTEGPLLIQAGAGSGKTKTLTHRIAHIISHKKTSPYNILAVTFTNKAAKEMRQRLAALLGQNPDNRDFLPFMGTFHSICVKILRQDGAYIAVPANFVIFDEADRLASIKQVYKQLHINEKDYLPRQISGLISSAKNELVSAHDYQASAQGPLQTIASKVFPHYEALLKNASALDFDDLIAKTVGLLQTHPEVRAKWQKQFHYILVDEYQDTNAAQYSLIKLLVGPDRNIAVVGDDWQSIYSWRGANYQNILMFEKDFPRSTVIRLEQNYRSTKHILDGAHAVIAKNLNRSDKKLWTDSGSGLPIQMVSVRNERNEGEVIARRISRAIESSTRNYNDFAVLYRTNAQSRALEEVCLQYGIPYRIVGGQRFYDRKEIKDIIAYIRVLFQPEDRVSFERIINVPTRGIGTKSLQQFFSWQATESLRLIDALARVEECPNLTPRAKKSLHEFGSMILDVRQNLETAPPVILPVRQRRQEQR
jgi:DNA helicase-2/ATP-dependent DNA helicase PcrA